MKKKLPSILCKQCKISFTPKTIRHIFCVRRCFKIFDCNVQKNKRKNENKFPVFHCPSCKNAISLNFNPITRPQKWRHFKCPHCNTLMINVCDSIKTTDSPLV